MKIYAYVNGVLSAFRSLYKAIFEENKAFNIKLMISSSVNFMYLVKSREDLKIRTLPS